MSIVVPPELLNIVKRANHATMQRAAAKVVQASIPGAARLPRYSKITTQTRTRLADGFQASLSGEVAKGAEFGGRRRPKVTYLRRGRAVRRRTTMQFLPHNSRGYALTPATRRSMSGIRHRIVAAVVRAVVS